MLDNVIQNVTSIAFRTFGRAILQNGGLGGGSSSGGGQKVSVVLPTFPPEDYEDEDESESSTIENSKEPVGLSIGDDDPISTSSSLGSDISDSSTNSPAAFTVRISS